MARQNGWMSANDIRELENLDRIYYYYFKIKPKRTGYIKALNNYSHGYTFAL